MSIEKLKTKENMRPIPERVIRPCEYGLMGSICDMEAQLGSIEAYNMIVDYASKLKAKIDSGHAQAQSHIFSTDTHSLK